MELTTVSEMPLEEAGFPFSSESSGMKVLSLVGLPEDEAYDDERVIWKKHTRYSEEGGRANIQMYEESEAMGLHVVPHYFDYAEGDAVRVVRGANHLGRYEEANVAKAMLAKREGWESLLVAASFARMIGKCDHGSHNMLWSPSLSRAFVIDADTLSTGKLDHYSLGALVMWWRDAYGHYSPSKFSDTFRQSDNSGHFNTARGTVYEMLVGMNTASC